MPFGLKNAAQTFQRLMDTVLQGLNFTFGYIGRQSQHDRTPKAPTTVVPTASNGLVLNLAKCQFGKQEIDFLGHHITTCGITPVPCKTAVIKEFTRPSTVKGLQEFLGMVNFYRRFVPSAARILQPLYQATAGKLKQLQWTEENISAFERTKEALASATLLAYPQANAPIAVTVDASSVAIGAAPEQLVDDSWQPWTHFFQQSTPTSREEIQYLCMTVSSWQFI